MFVCDEKSKNSGVTRVAVNSIKIVDDKELVWDGEDWIRTDELAMYSRSADGMFWTGTKFETIEHESRRKDGKIFHALKGDYYTAQEMREFHMDDCDEPDCQTCMSVSDDDSSSTVSGVTEREAKRRAKAKAKEKKEKMNDARREKRKADKEREKQEKRQKQEEEKAEREAEAKRKAQQDLEDSITFKHLAHDPQLFKYEVATRNKLVAELEKKRQDAKQKREEEAKRLQKQREEKRKSAPEIVGTIRPGPTCDEVFSLAKKWEKLFVGKIMTLNQDKVYWDGTEWLRLVDGVVVKSPEHGYLIWSSKSAKWSKLKKGYTRPIDEAFRAEFEIEETTQVWTGRDWDMVPPASGASPTYLTVKEEKEVVASETLNRNLYKKLNKQAEKEMLDREAQFEREQHEWMSGRTHSMNAEDAMQKLIKFNLWRNPYNAQSKTHRGPEKLETVDMCRRVYFDYSMIPQQNQDGEFDEQDIKMYELALADVREYEDRQGYILPHLHSKTIPRASASALAKDKSEVFAIERLDNDRFYALDSGKKVENITKEELIRWIDQKTHICHYLSCDDSHGYDQAKDVRELDYESLKQRSRTRLLRDFMQLWKLNVTSLAMSSATATTLTVDRMNAMLRAFPEVSPASRCEVCSQHGPVSKCMQCGCMVHRFCVSLQEGQGGQEGQEVNELKRHILSDFWCLACSASLQSDVECIICKNDQMCGSVMLPISSKNDCWVHLFCAISTPSRIQVQNLTFPKHRKIIELTISDDHSDVCSVCKSVGGTISESVEGVTLHYHAMCKRLFPEKFAGELQQLTATSSNGKRKVMSDESHNVTEQKASSNRKQKQAKTKDNTTIKSFQDFFKRSMLEIVNSLASDKKACIKQYGVWADSKFLDVSANAGAFQIAVNAGASKEVVSRIPCKYMYDLYVRYCQVQNQDAQSNTLFGTHFGFEKKIVKGSGYYVTL